ncbi:ribosomal-protein-alanine N-acetyltransferase [Dethiosulfatibacter aminovorans DSM 17477]|uniref:[Ribosomal protein bS18]-alanine N-acetyltransferase n=1 Tax=Dethiosulfatibacter aminovorans DSM 17477 TaxID=1121476 RepID=A0A1M6D1J2_9FIRM|nr:ribosomal protein S18-alanine N-acetyltransferase [Dethiosulfatibacter aminovorans]SHI67116.1 ribosomal-protein-alanine N-acetyltransferase [Dethiosulfatibacter aminovorans DSM 17477]
MNEIRFIEADINYLDGIMTVEKKCFTVPWSKNMFLSEMYNDNTFLYVLLENNAVIGYISLFKVLDEMHINNIAVDPYCQRKGYASLIMDRSIEIAKELSVTYLTLEVRKANTPAIELYKKYGFEIMGFRKDYYKNPKEDAIIMTKELF